MQWDDAIYNIASLSLALNVMMQHTLANCCTQCNVQPCAMRTTILKGPNELFEGAQMSLNKESFGCCFIGSSICSDLIYY